MTSSRLFDSLLIFLHIPKSGGTTLERWFYSEYQPEGPVPPDEEDGTVNYGIYHHPLGFEEDEHDDLASPPDLARILSRPDVGIALGHFAFGIHTLQPRPATYTTLLRRPVDRAMSIAYHILSWSEDPQRSVAAEEIEEYLATSGLTELDNGMTRRISGQAPPFGECSTAMLDAAKTNLREHFSVVGLIERFHESVVLFRNILGWRLDDLYYLPRLASPDRPREADLSPAGVAQISAQNFLDVELYEYGASIFDELVERYGPGLGEEVARLEALRDAQIRDWGYY